MSKDRTVIPPDGYNVRSLGNFEQFQPEWVDWLKQSPCKQPWFWQGLIPAETITLFAGSGGIGKSLVLLNLIANTSNGKEFQCGGETLNFPQGDVIMMSAEDNIKTQILPKLLAFDAHLENIHLITTKVSDKTLKSKFIELDKELHILEDKVLELREVGKTVKLLVIDPITYFIGDVQDHIQKDVCNFLHSLNEFATKYRLTILINKHRRKSSGKQTLTNLVDEIGGSGAWVNTPRQVLILLNHPTDEARFLMGSIKSNIAKKEKSAYCYSIESVKIETESGEEIPTTIVRWHDKKENIDIFEASSEESYSKSKTKQTEEIIYNHIKTNGITTINTLKEVCKRANINDRMRQRVLKSLIEEGLIRQAKGNKTKCFELTEDNYKADS